MWVSVLGWAAKHWDILLVLAALIMLGCFVKYKEHTAVAAYSAKVNAERLQEENDAKERDAETRRKQNEFLMRDITPAALGDILSTGTF